MQTATITQTAQSTLIVRAVAVVMYAAGTMAVMVGLVGIAVSLPPFPNGLVADGPETQLSLLSTANSITLTWTAPGDDNATGQASSYDLRYSTSPINDGNFNGATQVSNEPAPQTAGQAESFTVTGLQPSTTYHFALKTADEVPNWSALSNITSAATAAVACVPSWSCTDWSTCQNGTQSRSCTDTAVCGTIVGRPVLTQSCTASVTPGSCTPNWSCTRWTKCVNDAESRTCIDTNNCGSDDGRPVEQTTCGSGLGLVGEDLFATVPRRRSPAHVRIFNSAFEATGGFFASPTSARNGGSVAVGDTDGDGQLEVVAAQGYGSAPQFSVYTTQGVKEATIQPFSQRSRFGLRVFVGDLDADGMDEIIAVPERGASSIAAVYKYDDSYQQYVRIARQRLFTSLYREGINATVADINHDGREEFVVTRARDARPVVFIFGFDSARSSFRRLNAFYAFSTRDTQGLHVAAGDVDNDGEMEIVTAREYDTRPVVRVFDVNGRREYQFLAASSLFRGGVNVATIDRDLDGQDEIITAVSMAGPATLYTFRLDPTRGTFVRSGSTSVYASAVRYGLRTTSTSGL